MYIHVLHIVHVHVVVTSMGLGLGGSAMNCLNSEGRNHIYMHVVCIHVYINAAQKRHCTHTTCTCTCMYMYLVGWSEL